MVFQTYALWPHMTVARNVAFGLEERRSRAPRSRRRWRPRSSSSASRHFADRRPSQLSGGQQQRVALARTIVVEPKVLLLDEPLSNLDAKLRVQVRRELRELQRRLGLTTIFVTHDQEEANSICDRIAVMNEGAIQQVGTPMELYERPANLFVAGFLGTANILEGRPGDGSWARFRDLRGTISATARRQRRAEKWQTCFPSAKRTTQPTRRPGIPGIIVHREFLGAAVRYSVVAAGSEVSSRCPFPPGIVWRRSAARRA